MAFSKRMTENAFLVYCDSCFLNMTDKPFIRCAECVWDQCLFCFLKKEESISHRASHSFRLVSKLAEPLFNKEWRVIDELLFVHGLVSCGIGNFEDISFPLGNKNEKEVREHFYELAGIENGMNGELAGQELSLPTKSEPNDLELLSYMPKRHEFESEAFNDYEMLIEDLQFLEKDSQVERAFKRYLLNYYRTVLKRRGIWRSFIIDRNLIAVNEIKKHDGTLLGQVASKWKWLLQFVSKNDFNKFLDGLLREKILREQLERNGNHCRVDEPRLKDVSNLLSIKEKELCTKLNMSSSLYARLKRFSIECFIAKKPLRPAIYKFFNEEDHERVSVLYRWFLKQNIVYGTEKS